MLLRMGLWGNWTFQNESAAIKYYLEQRSFINSVWPILEGTRSGDNEFFGYIACRRHKAQ